MEQLHAGMGSSGADACGHTAMQEDIIEGRTSDTASVVEASTPVVCVADATAEAESAAPCGVEAAASPYTTEMDARFVRVTLSRPPLDEPLN